MRLQKFLASCGLGSRRACEQLIADGAVAVDGRTITEQGVSVDPDNQIVTVHGRVVRPESHCYILLNKPVGYVCTSSDPEGRDTFHALLPPNLPRVFSVGRLDQYSEGLLLVTNDGELTNRLTHPRHQVLKTYQALVERPLTADELSAMRRGIKDRDDLLRVQTIQWVRTTRAGTHYEMVLGEGKNRHIRRMFEALSVRVLRLRRVRMGWLTLGALKPGAFRRLSAAEIQRLKRV